MRISHRQFAFLIMAVALVAVVLASSDFWITQPVVSSDSAWVDRLERVGFAVAVVVALTFALYRWGVSRPVSRATDWLRERRLGAAGAPPQDLNGFGPLMREVAHLVASLDSARATAEQEARLRDEGESLWTAERLRAHIRGRLRRSPLIVVSNREPYVHVRQGGAIQTMVPASGVVTALEPVLRACDGTWIAHGSGDADRATVDANDRLRVPPEDPEYSLRRVWLTAEEEEGYYYGFANEGLWPLCHIAHTRPIFRASDWRAYEQANHRFAEASFDELAGTDRPLVLVQDYHFALLPRLIKARRPDARVGLFWHIPWPNPEAFGICPWQTDLIAGLLGADLIGFHTQAHCNNFLETVDRAMESQIEWDRFTVRRNGHVTHVGAFPISVDLPKVAPVGEVREDERSRADWLSALGVRTDFVGIGVDRIDYTKGILERLRALERFFEKWEQYRGRFTFVQIGAPSRTRIQRYQNLLEEVTAETARINARFGTPVWTPIKLTTRHHSHAEIQPYYRVADLCLVSALHDGMNLVAKEFVAERDDEDGVLVLSQFAGAARELRDALIVNPYDTEQMADAIRLALEMPANERRARMRRMRAVVRDHNVYRWAASLINSLADVRLDSPAPPRGPRRPSVAMQPTDLVGGTA